MSTQQIDPPAPGMPPAGADPAVAADGRRTTRRGRPAPEVASPVDRAPEAPGDRPPGGPVDGPAPDTAAPPVRIFNSLMWAVLVPAAAVAAGFLSQYPFGMLYVGIAVTLVVVASTAVIVGLRWGRAVTAALAATCVFALPFFAGPSAYELYAKRLGHVATATVLPGTHCSVRDADGTEEPLTPRQNCDGQFAPGQRVVLFRDPFGVLHPWAEATRSRAVPTRPLVVSGGLFALATVLILAAGVRRRPSPTA
ncbi:hypothetical protein [Streptomyces fuscigenes]|uniref:hypothetical protein n=1 Tax=Streptomyces fuscigenes TaxID=1528880 RepID=UPI001F2AB0C8|nr:hypothetical protein [Streptomyces fuscigenes]MCF3962201.1 hypothetical protein [Streptomyces fuscigenes]